MDENKEIQENNKNFKKSNSNLKKYYIFMGISILFLIFGGFTYNKYVRNANEIPVKKLDNNHKVLQITDTLKDITIYVPDSSFKHLVPLDVEYPSESFSTDVATIFNLIKENSDYVIVDRDGKHIPYFDQNINLLNSYLIGDQLYLNLSPNIMTSIKFKRQELLVIYSLVNTFTNLDGVNKVKILVNDKEIDRIKYFNLRTFYSKNLDI